MFGDVLVPSLALRCRSLPLRMEAAENLAASGSGAFRGFHDEGYERQARVTNASRDFPASRAGEQEACSVESRFTVTLRDVRP